VTVEKRLYDQIRKLSDQIITRIVMHRDDYKALLAELRPIETPPERVKGIPFSSFDGIRMEASDLLPQGEMIVYHANGLGTRVSWRPAPEKQPTEGPYAAITELHYALGGWDAYDADGNFIMRFPPDVVEESDWLSRLQRTRGSYF